MRIYSVFSVAKTDALLSEKQGPVFIGRDSPAIRFNLFEVLLCCDASILFIGCRCFVPQHDSIGKVTANKKDFRYCQV